jgi:hypothetical protein
VSLIEDREVQQLYDGIVRPDGTRAAPAALE